MENIRKFRNAVTLIIRGGILFAAVSISALIVSHYHLIIIKDGKAWYRIPSVSAQAIEAACPVGTSPIGPYGQVLNPTTGKIRQYACVDNAGNLTFVNGAGSGAGGAELGPQSIVVSPSCPQPFSGNCYYTPADTKVVWDASVTIGTKAVTCPNNDCNFVSTDNGKSCWGVDNSGAFSFTNAGGLGTLTVTGAQAATCDNGNTAVSTQTATMHFAYGHRDYANLQAAVAAFYALPACGTFFAPAGRMILEGGLTGTPPTSACSLIPTNYYLGAAVGVSFVGQGRLATVFHPSPNFNFNNCAVDTCFPRSSVYPVNSSMNLRSFQLDGLGATLSGISTAPANQFITQGQITGSSTDVFMLNWASAATNNPSCLQTNGQSLPSIGVEIANCGRTGLLAGANVLHIGTFVSDAGASFQCAGGIQCWDFGGAYNTNNANTVSILVQGVGTVFQGKGTYTQDAGAANTVSLDIGVSGGSNGTAICEWCNFPNGCYQGVVSSQATHVGIRLGIGATAILQNTCVAGGTTGGAILSNVAGNGTLINEGGNSSSSGPFLFSGTYIDLTGTFSTASCSGIATSSTNIAVRVSGLTATGAGIPSTCTGTTVDAGKAMTKAGTIYELIVKTSAAGSAAGSGVFTVTKNGVAQTMTCTIGTGTSCTDGATAHFVSYNKGDLISIALFPTSAAETLANPTVDLIAW